MFVLALIIIVGGLVLTAVGSLIWLFAQEFRKDRVTALTYHRLLSEGDIARGVPDDERVFVTYADRFEEQMKYLFDNGYNAISIDDFVSCLEGRKNLLEKPIIIAFDDGFESSYRYAYPVLRKYNLKATVFVTPDPESENFKMLKGVDSALTGDQMEEMSDNGISIQSHGMTHRLLTELSEEEIEWELEESKRTIEKITGKAVLYLAIPGGAYDKRVRRIADQTGYRAVFGGKKGTDNLRSDRFSLRRIVVERDFSMGDFAKVLTPWGACQMRIIGWFKRLPRKFLGYKGTEALRNWLYQSKAGPVFMFRNIRFFILGVVIAILTLTTLGLYFSMH